MKKNKIKISFDHSEWKAERRPNIQMLQLR